MANRIIGRRARRFNPAAPSIPISTARPLTWGMDISRSSSQRGLSTTADRQLASQYDGWVHAANTGVGSAQLQQFKDRLAATLNYIHNDPSNPYRNPDHQAVIYQIPHEAGCAEITSLQRSGTTLTMAFNMAGPPGLVLSGAVSLAQGLKIRQLLSPYDVFNGDYTTTGTGTGVIGTLVNYDIPTQTVTCTVPNSGPTTQDTSFNGVGIARTRGLESFEWMCTNNGWTRRVGTTGRRLTWTETFSTFTANLTQFAPVDGDGLMYAQWLAKYAEVDLQFSGIPGLAGYFQDNVNSIRDDALGSGDLGDWDRDGVQENRNGNFSSLASSVQASHRVGTAKYALKQKGYNSNQIIVANADNDLSLSGWSSVYDAAIMEHAHRFTTQAVYDRARVLVSTLIGPKISIYVAQSATAYGGTGTDTDYPFMRRHFARSLAVGFVAYAFCGANYTVTRRYDEMDAPLGAPLDPPRVTPNAGSNNLCIVRRYTNGLVVFNTSITTSDTVNIAAIGSYRKLSSADIGRTPLDAAFNNGATVNSLTLAPGQGGGRCGDGAILIKV